MSSDIVSQLQSFYNSQINNLNKGYDLHPNYDLASQIGEQYNTGIRGLPGAISSYQSSGNLQALQDYLNQNYLSASSQSTINQNIAAQNQAYQTEGIPHSVSNPLNPAGQITLNTPRTVTPTVSSPVVNSLTSALSSITSNSTVKSVSSSLSGISHIFLIGGVVVLFLLLRR